RRGRGAGHAVRAGRGPGGGGNPRAARPQRGGRAAREGGGVREARAGAPPGPGSPGRGGAAARRGQEGRRARGAADGAARGRGPGSRRPGGARRVAGAAAGVARGEAAVSPEPASTVVVDASALRPAALTPPLSKSDAHRALTLGALLGVAPRLPASGPLPSDVRVLRDGLVALAGPGDVEVDCADGGAPFRILLTQAALRPGQRTRFRGTPRLGERPHGPLLDALTRTLGPAGLRVVHEGQPWPLLVVGAGRAPEPRFTIDGSASSQFATSLLL